MTLPAYARSKEGEARQLGSGPRPDPRVPFEDSVGELAKMRQEGKIRHVGLSNVTIDQLARAQKIVPIVTV